MTTELIRRNASIPAEICAEIQQLMTSPAKYLQNLPTEGIADARPANAVTLSVFKRSFDRAQQLMYIGLMIAEVNGFFNVRGNMDAKQIKLTAELMLDNKGFYDLSLGNIKACFRQNMMSAKLYDRLDGNIIIGWLRDFKSELAEHRAETFSYEHGKSKSDQGMFYAEWLDRTEKAAAGGDKKAIKALADHSFWTQKCRNAISLRMHVGRR